MKALSINDLPQNLTFNDLPLAVELLVSEFARLKESVLNQRVQTKNGAPPPTIQTKKFATIGIDEAAELLDLPTSTVYNLARTGMLPGHQKGKLWRFYVDDVMKFKAEKRDMLVRRIRKPVSKKVKKRGAVKKAALPKTITPKVSRSDGAAPASAPAPVDPMA